MALLKLNPSDRRGDDEQQGRGFGAFTTAAAADALMHAIYIVMLTLLTEARSFAIIQICGLAVIAAVYALYLRGIIREGAASLALLCEIGVQSVTWMLCFGFPSLAYCHVLCFFIPTQLMTAMSLKMIRALQISSFAFSVVCIVIGVTVPPMLGGGGMEVFAAVTFGSICVMRSIEAFISKSQLTRSIARYERSIAGARDESMRDPLTGLWNRRYLEYSSKNYEFMSNTTPCTIAMLDLDLFKNVNDTYSHLVGDQMLLYFSTFLKKNLRASDHVVRWGGEEFLIIFTNTDVNQTFAVLNNLREDFKSAPMPLGDTFIPMTFTAGICQLKDGMSMQTAIEASDTLLYAGKAAGRDRVVAN